MQRYDCWSCREVDGGNAGCSREAKEGGIALIRARLSGASDVVEYGGAEGGCVGPPGSEFLKATRYADWELHLGDLLKGESCGAIFTPHIGGACVRFRKDGASLSLRPVCLEVGPLVIVLAELWPQRDCNGLIAITTEGATYQEGRFPPASIENMISKAPGADDIFTPVFIPHSVGFTSSGHTTVNIVRTELRTLMMDPKNGAETPEEMPVLIVRDVRVGTTRLKGTVLGKGVIDGEDAAVVRGEEVESVGGGDPDDDDGEDADTVEPAMARADSAEVECAGGRGADEGEDIDMAGERPEEAAMEEEDKDIEDEEVDENDTGTGSGR